MTIVQSAHPGYPAVVSLLIDSTNLIDCDSKYNISTRIRPTILQEAHFFHQTSYLILNFRSSHMLNATFNNLHSA